MLHTKAIISLEILPRIRHHFIINFPARRVTEDVFLLEVFE